MCIRNNRVPSLYLHSLVYIVILIFTIFSCFSFEIYYRTEAVACHIGKATVQYTAVKPTQLCFCYERANPSHSMTQTGVSVYFMRSDANLTCSLTSTQHVVL
jgi:hypothetical protein